MATVPSVTTFITRMDSTGTGIRLAVKDLIDVAGVPTTAGSRAVAQSAIAACHDAECMAGARAAGARIVGKTNLHELALGTSGVNEWFGTPVNPIDPRLVPGGSSSGSAVAVATGEADVAFGTDTGGSIRIPSACCGTTGLKTTWGRVSLKGVYPCAPSLDTVGPMARDVRGVIAGMQLLEPGFAPDPIPPAVVGRLRVPASPEIDKAIDSALSAAGFEIVDLEIPGWKAAGSAASAIIMSEVWAANRALATGCRDKIGADVLARLDLGAAFRPEEVRAAHAAAGAWQAELHLVFERVELLALPTLAEFPPTLERAQDVPTVRCTLQVNIAGVPALAIPVPAGGPVPASLQLVGPSRTEERLVAAGLLVERALA